MSDTHKQVREQAKKQWQYAEPAGQLAELSFFDEVQEMILAGAMTRDIVAYIHGKKELTHVSRKALSYQIARYRRHLHSDHGGVTECDIRKQDILDQEDPVSVALALREQFFAMHERLRMQTKLEMELNILFPSTSKEFATSAKIGEQLLKVYKEFDMLDASSPTGARHDMSFKGPINIEEVMTRPQSRQKILGILDLIAKNPDMFENLSAIDKEDSRRKRPKKKRTLEVVPDIDVSRKAQ